MQNATMLAGDASWLPHRLLHDGAALQFIHADRAAQRLATFLDDQSLGEDRPRADVRLQDLAGAAVAERAPVHFVFHSAFACSTLFARALDLPGHAMGLKEPIVLNDAVQLLRRKRLTMPALDLVLRLLERPLEPGEAMVIKPSNVANPLMPALLDLRPQARAILLYRDLPAYLRSIAKRGMFGRIWARRHLSAIRNEANFNAGFSPDDLLLQTDLQAAGYGWLIQHAQFAALASKWPDRVRMLEAGEFLANREETLARTAAWFDLDLPPAMIADVVAGAAFSEDSKRLGQLFGEGGSDSRSPVDDDEVRMVTQWVEAVASHVGLSFTFGPRLLH